MEGRGDEKKATWTYTQVNTFLYRHTDMCTYIYSNS